jgi:hypothetical protein
MIPWNSVSFLISFGEEVNWSKNYVLQKKKKKDYFELLTFRVVLSKAIGNWRETMIQTLKLKPKWDEIINTKLNWAVRCNEDTEKWLSKDSTGDIEEQNN